MSNLYSIVALIFVGLFYLSVVVYGIQIIRGPMFKTVKMSGDCKDFHRCCKFYLFKIEYLMSSGFFWLIALYFNLRPLSALLVAGFIIINYRTQAFSLLNYDSQWSLPFRLIGLFLYLTPLFGLVSYCAYSAFLALLN